MKWKKTDLEKYIQEKQYIDTLLIPLLPISFSTDQQLASQAFQNELLTILTNGLEQNLAGRVLLTPTYHYLKLNNKIREDEMNRLNEWIKNAQNEPFKHYFLITHDLAWKKEERALDGTLLWIPTVTSGDIQSEEINRFTRDQLEQLVELIRSYW